MASFIDRTVGGWLDDMAKKHPEHEALVYVDRGLRLTYHELNEVCRRAARGFYKMGIRRGDHVAIWATNYPEWLITLFATAKLGAVLVTVNTNYKTFELEYLLRQSDSMTMVFIDGIKTANYVDIINELLPELAGSAPGALESEKLPCLKNLIYVPNPQNEKSAPSWAFSWDNLLKMGDSVPARVLDEIEASLSPHDVVNMQYTSGTTGFPKGVMLTHYNIINNGFYIGENMKLTEADRLCIPVPFFHCFGLVLAVMACLTHASTMVPVEVYSPTAVMNTIQKERCTAVHGVPTMYIFMLEHRDFNKYDFSSLRTGIMAGSPCPIATMRQVIEKMNMREITISYGQTEASPVTTMTNTADSLEHRVSTVGRAMPAIECKIVDAETGEDVPDGTQGEFCCRGYNVMRGYYKMEEATRAVIDADGWLHSGDIAVRDEDGYFKITGRIKDMIIRGGENIYPREIEELIYTHNAVQDVQVIGIPSEKFGEEVMACIILKKNMNVTTEEMHDFIAKNMSRHKIPSYIKFVDSFPMTASGKIQKFKMRDAAVAELNLGAAAGIETA
ncbi:MAG: AMP-binding protein [Clostridia bacterium]